MKPFAGAILNLVSTMMMPQQPDHLHTDSDAPTMKTLFLFHNFPDTTHQGEATDCRAAAPHKPKLKKKRKKNNKFCRHDIKIFTWITIQPNTSTGIS